MSRYFDCGTLVDGRGDVLDDARVGVEDGTIREVGPQEDVPSDGERVDLSGEVVVPGLVDAHCHLQGLRSMNPVDWVLERSELGAARATADLRRLLRAGFTAVRDVGGTTGLALRDAVDEGEIPGSRIYTSGQSISQTGGHGDAHFLPYEWVRLQTGGRRCHMDTERRYNLTNLALSRQRVPTPSGRGRSARPSRSSAAGPPSRSLSKPWPSGPDCSSTT